MIALYHESHFTFRFGDSRRIELIHLEGVPPGRTVTLVRIDATTGERLGIIASAVVGDGGWVDLPQAIVVSAGDAFIAE